MQNDNAIWAKTPRKFLVANLNLLKKGSVLDLGGSDGTNGLYLSEQGYEVTNVDKDADAINNLKVLSKENSLEINTEVANLDKYKIKNNYNNIITFYTLHFLQRENATNLLNQMKEKTTKDGINLIVSFTNVGEFDTSKNFFLKKNELLEIYSDWNILKYSKVVRNTKSGLMQERAFFVARNE